MNATDTDTVLDRVFVVMPVANEEASIEPLVREILALPQALHLCPVMDKFSKDRTQEIIEGLQNEYEGRLELLFYEGSTGVASCYLYGFKAALDRGATAVVEMDGGGSHQPSDIPTFLDKLAQGYECVFGSRFIEGGRLENQPLSRKFLSRGGTILANTVLRTKLRDMTSGFEAFRAEVLRALDLDAFLSRAHMFQTEMRYYCRKLRIAEIPIRYVGSQSSLKGKTILRALKILFRLPFRANARLCPHCVRGGH